MFSAKDSADRKSWGWVSLCLRFPKGKGNSREEALFSKKKTDEAVPSLSHAHLAVTSHGRCLSSVWPGRPPLRGSSLSLAVPQLPAQLKAHTTPSGPGVGLLSAPGGSPVEMEEVTGPPLKSGTQRVSAPRWWESEELRKPGNLLEHTVGRGLTSLTQQVLGQEMLPAQPLPQRAHGPEHLSRRVC